MKKSNDNYENENALKNFILEKDHPCLMAQSIFRQGNFELHEYGNLGDSSNAQSLLKDIKSYIEKYDFSSNDFFTFIAVFKGQNNFSEIEFEKLLWQQLQSVHDIDSSEWDSEVDSDPDSEKFSFSIGGKAFYIVGMHPNSSRMARQAPFPMLVFNLHHQFEQLRNMGAYDITRTKIRERDTALQGYPNPMLEDFGQNKEASQYSGREVSAQWKCPFLAQQRKTA